MTVTLPGGGEIPLTYGADNFFGKNTGTCGVYYLSAVDLSPEAGAYTFSVTDRDENAYSVSDDLTPDPIGFPNNALSDAIIALQVMAGLNPQGIQSEADVNGDGRIGLEEAVHALQKAAGLR